MKQADLRIGHEYAFPTYSPYDDAPLAARVSVVSIDGGGKVTVQVVDPGPRPPARGWRAVHVKKSEQRQIKTRDIACPWSEWAERAASIGAEKKARIAEQRARHDEWDRERADRLAIDPGRALPKEYDEEVHFRSIDLEERSELTSAYITARNLGPYATPESIAPLLSDLPVMVLRDILAANKYREPVEPGSVAATFARAAWILDIARVALRETHDGRVLGEPPQPERVLNEVDLKFAEAVRVHIVAAGGALLLPPVPALPSWLDEPERAFLGTFGWLRLAVGDTNGRLLHSPGCSSVRSRPVLEADSIPWWQRALEIPERVCGRCGGPAVRDLVPLAGFVAAADVWNDRGRDRVEQWQQAAFQRLLAATASARAQALEPDITLAWRIVDAFAADPLGEEGWAAYATIVPTGWSHEELAGLTPSGREAARALVRERIVKLEALLPETERLLPLPKAADVQVLRQRHRHWKDRLRQSVPQLDRLLFTLPGAD
ncbi:hypothetical protein [Amycolatopsis tucumanensis]|uniref:hypothetical protein n=1 Tax=Amycolatopsis tucumanensis TaxID=401106 RepID=UPI001F450B65|nr:hypothetical protein [Amycolatopsis tucumanensis]MCF6425816.1 hypothetical protein [Amycolatopsis tucumanensis]